MVDDRGHEDRPGRAGAARLRARAQRGRWLRRPRARRGDQRLAGGGDRAARRARRGGRGHRRDRAAGVGGVRARHRRTRRARAGAPSRWRRAHTVIRRGVRGRDLARAGAARVLTGRPGEQPQRRARLGPGPALPRRERREHRRGRTGRRHLSGRLGRGPDLDGPLVRPRRAQAPDRQRHADPGRGTRRARRLRRRGRDRRAGGGAARRRHRARLPDADRGDLRRRPAGRPRACGRRLSLLARHGLRGRRPARGSGRRQPRLRWRHRRRRRPHRRLGPVGPRRSPRPYVRAGTRSAVAS